MIYLEELPAATMQRIMVDSATIGDDGKYKLKAESGQASVYTLRLDQQAYPMASVINDVNKITLYARFGKGNSQFAEDYMVKGSKASQYLKDFMVDFNNELQQLFMLNRQHDSLTGASAGDSARTATLRTRRTASRVLTRLRLRLNPWCGTYPSQRR